MTFARIKAAGWAVGEKLTSAQQNQLDIDHSNAVDKTGDTLAGTIHVSGSGKISADLHDTIVSTVDSGISTTHQYGISIQHDQGLVFDSSNGWGAFRSGRSYQRNFPLRPIPGFTAWSLSVGRLVGPGTNTSIDLDLEVHHGSTLTTIDVFLSVSTTHSAVPSVMPGIRVRRDRNCDPSLLGSAPVGLDDLYSGGVAFFPTPASGTAWYASGGLQKWTITCDQNNVIDRTKYRYILTLTDESGSNAIAGNLYYGHTPNYTAITSMQFR